MRSTGSRLRATRVVVGLCLLSLPLTACGGPREARLPVPRHISFEEIGNLTIPLESGQSVTLRDGRARVSYGGASADEYSLARFFAEGKISGHRGAAVVLVNDTAGTGTFYDVVAVSTSERGLVATKPFLLGDRVAVQRLVIASGRITVTFLDQGNRGPMTELHRQVTLTLAATETGVKEVGRRTVPLRDSRA